MLLKLKLIAGDKPELIALFQQDLMGDNVLYRQLLIALVQVCPLAPYQFR